MTTNSPIWLSVTYAELPCQCHVALRISANNAPNLAISVAHEGITEVTGYDLAGNGSIDLQVQDNETLMVVVRNDHSEIIACGLFEVSLDLIETLSAVLNPCVASNLIVDQCAQRLIDNAVTRAINEACPAVTGELVAEVAR